jgi:hypothetical protein
MGLIDGGRIEGVLEIDCQSIRPIFGYQLQHSRAWNPCAEVNRPRNASNALIQDASHASLYFAERFIEDTLTSNDNQLQSHPPRAFAHALLSVTFDLRNLYSFKKIGRLSCAMDGFREYLPPNTRLKLSSKEKLIESRLLHQKASTHLPNWPKGPGSFYVAILPHSIHPTKSEGANFLWLKAKGVRFCSILSGSFRHD